MATNSSDAISAREAGLSLDLPVQPSPPGDLPLDQNTLIRELESAQKIDRASVVNMLNYIHFVDGAVLVHLRYRDTGGHALVHAYPRPCSGKTFSGYWSNGGLSAYEMKNCRFLHLIIEDGKSMIFVPVTLLTMTREAFEVQLPETSYAVGRRQAKRHVCRQVNAELVQNNLRASGHLLDFNPFGFRIMMTRESSGSFDLFDSDAPVTVHLKRDQQVFFSGLCRFVRRNGDRFAREVVLASEAHQIRRFNKKRIRNPRQRPLTPATIVFEHPLLRKEMHIEVYDISTSGFSIYERRGEEILIPGMIITKLAINFGGVWKMSCTAQVIYRLDEKEKGVRCGFSILDMDIDTYSRLFHILSNVLDPHCHISNEVDLDSLWKFFFDTGFIYPEKYYLIQSDREYFKETYRRLYQENPEIARHFTYQENNVIYGHISMVRAYERAWLIHHHATKTLNRRRIGFLVLKQIIHYLNDMHRLPFAHMDFLLCYFRPENKFPSKVFGSFTGALKDARGCSMDLFSYLLHRGPSVNCEMSNGWSIQECTETDFLELHRWYNSQSSGLLLEALGLGQGGSSDEPLEAVYDRLGFVRRVRVHSLSQQGKLGAVLIVNQSEKGFNLSGLLNCIKVLVTDSEGLSWNTLSRAIQQLANIYQMDGFPVLVYPTEYVEVNHVPHEKRYHLWILNIQYGYAFVEYLQKRFRTCFG